MTYVTGQLVSGDIVPVAIALPYLLEDGTLFGEGEPSNVETGMVGGEGEEVVGVVGAEATASVGGGDVEIVGPASTTSVGGMDVGRGESGELATGEGGEAVLPLE